MNHIAGDWHISGSSSSLLGKAIRSPYVIEINPSLNVDLADLYLAPLYFYQFIKIFGLGLLMVIMTKCPQYFCSC